MAATNLRIGDSVTVPGDMYGTLKFVGPVQGKKGIFAGVQLAPEYAARGKNSGDVDGKHYFRTSVPGAGIFLPVDKAAKRNSGGSVTSATGGLSTFSQGGRTSSAGVSRPNFSQSLGPGNLAVRTASPTALKPPGRRESLPRPSSPLRRVNNAATAVTPAAGRLATPKTRPSLGFNKSTIGVSGNVNGGTKSPGLRQPSSVSANRFGQSLRQSMRGPGSVTPNRVRQPTSSAASVATTTTEDYSLGPEPSFDESPPRGSGDEGADHTPTPAAGRSFKSKADAKKHEDEMQGLREQLDQRDRLLGDQANSIAEMERSLVDLQQMMSSMDSGQMYQTQAVPEDEGDLPRDVQDLRAALRDKNERIKAMTAEFDNNRADFRSTIDTLEMASTETERVYERRVEELLEEVKHLQDSREDVEGVAQQFRQLEELVQELEEGLEDARRGEAEARGEVEFLRGEVERGRSELRRERERNRAGDKLNGIDPDGGGTSTEEVEELQLKLDQKDDEIRGLKAIIQNLNDSGTAPPTERDSKAPKVNGGINHGHSKTKSTNTVISVGAVTEDTSMHLQDQIRDLEALLHQKSTREEQLQEEVTKLRQSVQFGVGSKFVVPGLEGRHQRTNSQLAKHRSDQSSSTITAGRSSGSSFTRGYSSRREAGNLEFVDAEQFPLDEEAENHAHNDPQKTPDAASVSAGTETSSNALWCEICEESGHDILTCGQMISGPPVKNEDNLATPTPRDSNRTLTGKDPIRIKRSNESQGPPPSTSMPPPPTGPPARVNRSSLEDVARPAPLSMSRQPSSQNLSKAAGAATSPTKEFKRMNSQDKSQSTSKLIEGVGDQAGMLAGKESGIIDPNKWCALCERDGHDSVDCPVENSF